MASNLWQKVKFLKTNIWWKMCLLSSHFWTLTQKWKKSSQAWSWIWSVPLSQVHELPEFVSLWQTHVNGCMVHLQTLSTPWHFRNGKMVASLYAHHYSKKFYWAFEFSSRFTQQNKILPGPWLIVSKKYLIPPFIFFAQLFFSILMFSLERIMNISSLVYFRCCFLSPEKSSRICNVLFPDTMQVNCHTLSASLIRLQILEVLDDLIFFYNGHLVYFPCSLSIQDQDFYSLVKKNITWSKLESLLSVSVSL